MTFPWTDSKGNTCGNYVQYEYCINMMGQYLLGPGWVWEDIGPEDVANAGMDAFQVRNGTFLHL